LRRLIRNACCSDAGGDTEGDELIAYAEEVGGVAGAVCEGLEDNGLVAFY
jgi:hypothetical protein